MAVFLVSIRVKSKTDAPPRLLTSAPRLGEHTAALLAAAGYTAGEIAALVASGAAQVAVETAAD